MTGVYFPVNDQGIESLRKLQNKEIQYVQLVSNSHPSDFIHDFIFDFILTLFFVCVAQYFLIAFL
jgi:hypothetical protein